MAATETIAPADTTALNDSVAFEPIPGLHYGIMLEHPSTPVPRPLGESNNTISWILSGFVIVFVVACVRYRKNTRFFSMMLHDVTNIRERQNAFDDTLRETSFLWLLNLLWCGSAGILLYGFFSSQGGGVPFSLSHIGRMGICIGMAGAYTLFLAAAYSVVGNLFSDSAKASLWVKGFLSTQAMESILLFPAAMLAICVPTLEGPMFVAGAIIFIFAKLLFIYKGFCIFFTQIASWVLFLYYLCSLEIVPVVLTYVATRYLCYG